MAMADTDAGTTAAEQVSIEDIGRRHPEWSITRAGNMTIGWYWTATPRREIKPPVFDHNQLRRGLDFAVSHADLAELDRRITEQEWLCADMPAAELARVGDGQVAIRQNTDLTGPALVMDRGDFAGIVADAKAGALDHLLA